MLIVREILTHNCLFLFLNHHRLGILVLSIRLSEPCSRAFSWQRHGIGHLSEQAPTHWSQRRAPILCFSFSAGVSTKLKYRTNDIYFWETRKSYAGRVRVSPQQLGHPPLLWQRASCDVEYEYTMRRRKRRRKIREKIILLILLSEPEFLAAYPVRDW